MPRSPSPLALIPIFLALISIPGRSQDLVPWLRAELSLERQLLADDLEAYGAARQSERRLAERARDLAAELDDRLAREEQALADLERLGQVLAEARTAWEAAGNRSHELLERIVDRLRRTALLEERLERAGGEEGARPPDPVSGRWFVRLAPQEESGFFRLELDGALISGSYELEGGARGSLKGTFLNRDRLRLERIDSESGLASTFEGKLDAAGGKMEGIWTTAQPGDGGPGGGTWSAVKVSE